MNDDNTTYPLPLRPNILITGTPGTGKTTLCELVSEMTGLNLIDVGGMVRDEELHEGRDEEFDCFILDEDKVVDAMESIMVHGGNVVDFHTCDFFPERWFHLIVVLRTDNNILFQRLEKRQYSQKKITENVSAEILEVCLNNARESYDENIVIELQSNTVEDMESNAQRTVQWYQQFLQNNPKMAELTESKMN